MLKVMFQNHLLSKRLLKTTLSFTLLSLLFLTGCSASSGLGDVTGVVTLDGAPLSQAIIFFKPEAEGATAFGRTDENGRYQLTYVGNRQGTLPGVNKVRITTRQETENEAGRIVWTKEKVPAKYNEETTLIVDVKPGKSTHNFELTSK
ncbi:carboxypeptidase regulatory-like domain-containing protein [Bremerella cremea]|uniref:Carboxypeptidase regulatory-like domain-containing protein n=1 Tax=Bremerella cremea TaxID=1031537 RepID=A0A368KMD5_9BACT|nr:carboxypeptidase-like regulatory domain-containing protein [Bremerella cremea]RCS43239.1 carboxypeptidase regulatory-like domain-containing protein [Bremerella cremea]